MNPFDLKSSYINQSIMAQFPQRVNERDLEAPGLLGLCKRPFARRLHEHGHRMCRLLGRVVSSEVRRAKPALRASCRRDGLEKPHPAPDLPIADPVDFTSHQRHRTRFADRLRGHYPDQVTPVFSQPGRTIRPSTRIRAALYHTRRQFIYCEC